MANKTLKPFLQAPNSYAQDPWTAACDQGVVCSASGMLTVRVGHSNPRTAVQGALAVERGGWFYSSQHLKTNQRSNIFKLCDLKLQLVRLAITAKALKWKTAAWLKPHPLKMTAKLRLLIWVRAQIQRACRSCAQCRCHA